MTNVVAVLDSESQEISSDSLDIAAAGICGTIGNLLGAASDNAAFSQPNTTNLTSSQSFEQLTSTEIARLKVSDQVFL